MQERFETFTVLLNRISRNIRKIKKQEMARYHLKGAHASCLYYLYSVGSMTVTELCDYCEEDKATISRCVEVLESGGYLTRQNTQVRYRSPLVLTEQGRVLGEMISEKISAVLKEIDSAMTDEERSAFYHSFGRISERLDVVARKE